MVELEKECKKMNKNINWKYGWDDRERLEEIYNQVINLKNEKCPLNILRLEKIAEDYLKSIHLISKNYKLNKDLKIVLICLLGIIVLLLIFVIYKI